ncbi:MAG TPA: hypothetical protein VKA84_22675, partial [Gemmatimonadaceae bacterium]|nr:hypothetical protein [Gemmatimonadaceae bacterium]
GGGVALLTGDWGAMAEPIADLVDVQLLLLDPPAGASWRERVSVVRADEGAAPFTVGFLRAAAVDARSAATERLAAVSRALRPRGRLLAPADVPVPADVAELARDERHWVGERTAGVSQPVRLGISRRR